MLPLMTYLRDSQVLSGLAHRYVDTIDGLVDAASKWTQKQYDNLPLGYFGFHGDPGGVWLGRKWIPLRELAEPLTGKCAKRVIYFGSCSVFADNDEAAWDFLRVTGARAVIGYQKRLAWIPSSAFDLLVFEALSKYQLLPSAEAWLRREYGEFAEKLGLVMFHRSALTKRAGG
jgi:hypothetical protein